MTLRILLSSIALSLLTLTTAPALAQTEGNAHPPRAQKSPEEKAEAMTRRMTNELTLTAEQQAKVAALNEQLLADLSALRSTEKKVKGERRAQAQEIRSGYEASLRATLSAEQLTQYEKLRAERKAKHQDGRKGRHGGHGKAHKAPAPASPAK